MYFITDNKCHLNSSNLRNLLVKDFYLFLIHGKRHKEKHQKSRPRAHTPLIIFNETFLFHMPEPLAWDCTVLVSIYEVDSDSRHLVGQATLGKRRAKEAAEHWDLMIKSIQQPVAKWHPLLI
uniref:C2 domain-containing protein n=1 Tax=Calidris pygmaea TaxID=425635 RepID=A0A8C3PL50_9CHAR